MTRTTKNDDLNETKSTEFSCSLLCSKFMQAPTMIAAITSRQSHQLSQIRMEMPMFLQS